MRYVEYLRWQVRLWLVDFGQRVHDREVHLAVTTVYDRGTRFARFVDLVSPWSRYTGYTRRSLRRLLYTIRYPIQQQRFWSLSLVQTFVYSMVPRPSLGRYESYNWASKALKAEWLDTHSELANESTGDSDTYIWAALFEYIDVPWSLEWETWCVTVDGHGFVSADSGENAIRWYEDISKTYEQLDNIEEYSIEYDLNPEGDPTRNGAFG